MIYISKQAFSLEYKRFGVEPVRITGNLMELKTMGRKLARLDHIQRVWIRNPKGQFVYSAIGA